MLMLLGLIVPGLQGQENDVRFTGQGWHDWPQGTRVAYVSGFAEGYANATTDVTLKACLKAPKQSSKAVSETLMPIVNSTIACWRGMRYGQLLAIVDKYVADHPERWHEPIAELVRAALTNVCGENTLDSTPPGSLPPPPPLPPLK
jgi:hypothetical protein